MKLKVPLLAVCSIAALSSATRRQEGAVAVEKHADELTYGGHYIERYRRSQPEATADILEDLVAEWHATLAKHKIPYWLFAGSLLGVRCFKGPLRGDDDVDVGMLASDFTRLVALMAIETPEAGRYRLIVRAGTHADIIGAKFVDTWNGRFVDVGLFYNKTPLTPYNGPLVQYWSTGVCPRCDTHPTRLELPRNLLYPLQNCNFGATTASCPRNIDAVCRMMYRTPWHDCPFA
jgi:hypothetical protein